MISAEKIIHESEKAFHRFRLSTLEFRAGLLLKLAGEMENQKKRFTDSIIREVFKPFTLAEAEVNRAIATLKIAAAEIDCLKNQEIDSNTYGQGKDFENTILKYFPRGPILAIGPFNFPLNLLIHKIAPGLASGSPLVVKPPHQGPTACKIFCDLFQKVAKDLDPEEKFISATTIQIISARNEEMAVFVEDPRLPTISFTGSEKVGWSLPVKAPHKKIILELGGNATVLVTENADLDLAAKRLAFGSFAYAGQICISVQRILIDKNIYSGFKEKFIEATKEIHFGDLYDKKTLINKMIDSAAADKIEEWISHAEKKGAKALIPWTRNEQIITPVILENIDHAVPLWCEEAFGPVVAIEPFNNFENAIKIINDSNYGIHAAIFSNDEKLIETAIEKIDTAGLLINEIPTLRLDHLPYGGIKKSGLGREGPRYAMKEFSEQKVILRKKT